MSKSRYFWHSLDESANTCCGCRALALGSGDGVATPAIQQDSVARHVMGYIPRLSATQAYSLAHLAGTFSPSRGIVTLIAFAAKSRLLAYGRNVQFQRFSLTDG